MKEENVKDIVDTSSLSSEEVKSLLNSLDKKDSSIISEKDDTPTGVSSWLQNIQDDLDEFVFEDVLPISGIKYKYKPIYTELSKKLLKIEKSKYSGVDKVLDIIINGTLLSPKSLDLDDMYISDRNYYIIQLRKKSKGSKIEVTEKCPNCNSEFRDFIDLDNFEIKKFDPLSFDPILKLTKSSVIELELIKKKHLVDAANFTNELESYKKKRKFSYEKEEKDTDYSIAIIAGTIKNVIINGITIEEVTLSDKIKLISSLPLELVDKLQEWHIKNKYGIIYNTIKISCPHCNNYEKVIDIIDQVTEDGNR